MAKFTSLHGTPPASLKDIARELDVSYSLVSKVLSGRLGTTGVRAAVKEAIIRKAEEMNYRPNPLAFALKQGRKGAVGALIHPMGERGSELTSDFLHGLSSGLDDHGLRLWLRFFETDADFARHFNQRTRNEVDGLIIAGVPHPSIHQMLLALHKDGLPLVTALERDHMQDIPNAMMDNVHACYLTTRHLIQRGARRIAQIRNVEQRHRGFLAAHVEAGLTVNPDLIIDSPDDYTFGSGAKAVASLISRGLAFDGLVAQSDHEAVGAVHELLRRGLRVPEDVRVTGVDNSPVSEGCIVPITSVTAEMKIVGRTTAHLLAKRLKGETADSVIVQPSLVVRASS